MIASLSGTVLRVGADHVVLGLGGVGLRVFVPRPVLEDAGGVGRPLRLHTHLVVREDAQLLYGFYSLAERRMFRTLIRISGVGPKLALTILSGISAEEFSRAIFENDVAALTGLPGVGKKTAERLVVELRDKLDAGLMPPAGVQAGVVMPGTELAANPVSDAVSALIALGYKPAEASRLVRAVETRDLATEDIIRSALQGAARHA